MEASNTRFNSSNVQLDELLRGKVDVNASINSSNAHSPPGNHGAFAQMSVPGVGH